MADRRKEIAEELILTAQRSLLKRVQTIREYTARLEAHLGSTGEVPRDDYQVTGEFREILAQCLFGCSDVYTVRDLRQVVNPPRKQPARRSR